MVAELHPDAGSTAQCTSAAETIETIARDLASATNRADTHRDIVTNGCWTGDAANAFIETLTTTTTAATQTVTAWQNLAATIRTYAEDLLALRDEANRCRTALDGIDSDLADYRHRLEDAEDEDGEAGTSYVISTLRQSITTAEQSRAAELAKLEDIGARRLDLDSRTVTHLDGSPGPGAAAWIALAYRGPDVVPLDELTDDIIDLIESDPYANRELITQFLAMHGTDPAAMDAFYTELSAAGLLDLIEGTVGDMTPGPDRNRLTELISTSLALAAQQWDTQKQHDYGVKLVRAIEANDEDARQSSSYLLADFLDAPGMPGNIGVGVIDRIDRLRTEDPEIFADITREVVISPDAVGVGSTLMNTAMQVAATVPADALGYFTQHPDAVTYWYGLHPWAWDGFGGPAALLDAIAHIPGLTHGATTEPPSTEWVDALSFFSGAMESLGGSLSFSTETSSDRAKHDIAHAASVFIPEIAAMTQDRAFKANGQVALTLRDGDGSGLLALEIEPGNLARALGIALTDPSGLALYLQGAQAYAQEVLGLVTAEDHPSYEHAAALIDSVGHLYGHTYASYSVEAALDAERISDAQRQTLDTVFAVASLIPSVSAGKKGLDYLLQVGQAVAPEVAITLTPGILTDDEISAVKHAGEKAGLTNLDKTFRTPFLDALLDLRNSYVKDGTVQGAESFQDNLSTPYDTAIDAFGNETVC